MERLLTECQKCGACCIAGRGPNQIPGWANVEWGEREELLKHIRDTDLFTFPPINWWEEEAEDAIKTRNMTCHAGPLKGEVVTACRFLQGIPGQEVRCKIYEHRPAVCHAYEPGGQRCAAKQDEVFRLNLEKRYA